MTMKKVLMGIKLCRPKHYLKNCLIFVPLIFSLEFFNTEYFERALYGFVSFSLMASAIYIINDIKDVESDRLHETKKARPIAAGFPVSIAIMICVSCFSVSVCLTAYIHGLFDKGMLILIAYFIMNLAYSLFAKNVPLVDIVILVSGFMLRILYGAVIIDVYVSSWLYLTVMALSFYLGLGKRRNELNLH